MGRIFETGKRPVIEKISRRWKAQQLEELSYETVAKMNLNELVNVAGALQSLTRRRRKAIEKEGLFSHALDKFSASFAAEKAAGIKTANPFAHIIVKRKGVYELGANFSGVAGQARLLDTTMRYLDFVQSVTSTPAGIRSTNNSQDAMIFGTDENGNPLYSMGDDERKFFWQVVDEFRANPTSKVYDFYSFLDSGIIEMWRNPETRPDTLREAVDLVNKLNGGYIFDPESKTVKPVSEYQVGYRPYQGQYGGITNAQQRQNFDFLQAGRGDLTHAEPKRRKRNGR